ncbi:DUF2157 domain-containing protein [Shewanella sp. C32]|uniref:DUF2157 domain-containing protein n=1 Tax=Shewanella electrica TaxID=515560 RepID=A0ABT2FHA4_9GAMM|nr:DUF2157 domain-containing protein [Shewanella electrica]MCH1923622.1 DUF2157 domain-containing protein [Shewanella electrica]MCS4555718.1 DUF2157 domain-containing protein [Shewanella electrica]
MKLTRQRLKQAVEQQIVSAEQAERLFSFFEQQSRNEAQFSFTHILYYVGGLIAIGAMSLFMNLGWEAFGGLGIVAISLVYALLGLSLTRWFAKQSLVIPAGICATFVVVLTPLAIYGVQQALGLWPESAGNYRDYHHYVRWYWLYMELGTLSVGVIMAWKLKYPFMLMPIAVTLWYLTMDVTVMLAGDDYSWQLRKLVSMYAGLLMIALAFWVDIRARHSADYAFWIYLFGVLAFWCGLTTQESDSELAKLGYFGINLLMIAVGAVLVRRVFVVFGALGCTFYLGHLADDVFKDSWLFPMSLTLLGLLIVYLGVLWQKHEQSITQKVRCYLPAVVQELLASKDVLS